MKQVSIRKRLSVLGLALMVSAMAQGFKHPDEVPSPYPPGPSVASVIVHEGSPIPYPPGPSIIAVL